MLFPEAAVLAVGNIISEHNVLPRSGFRYTRGAVWNVSVRSGATAVVDISPNPQIAQNRFASGFEGAWLIAECEMIFIQLLQLSF